MQLRCAGNAVGILDAWPGKGNPQNKIVQIPSSVPSPSRSDLHPFRIGLEPKEYDALAPARHMEL